MADEDDEDVKPVDMSNTMIDLSEHKSQVATMWSSAAEVNLVDTEEIPKGTHHFDLAGLAQGLSETATIASSVSKLQNDLA